MTKVRRFSVVLVIVVVTAACGDARPTAPTSVAPQPSLATGGFPPLSGPARIYSDDHRPLYPPHSSRFALYDDGRFALQVSDGHEWRGRYQEAAAPVVFEWEEGQSFGGSWRAIGTLAQDSLSVSYNLIMQLDGFVDGTYVRRQQ